MSSSLRWDPISELMTWSHFGKPLSESFGNKQTREKAIVEWKSVAHKLGKIDKYLNHNGQLGFLHKFNRDTIMDNVIGGLYQVLWIQWAKVENKPEVLLCTSKV